MRDALALEGAVMLGSRLKRLAERLQTGAERIAVDCGLPMQPSQMPLLTALYRRGPMTVGDAVQVLGVSQPAVTRILSRLVEMGLVETSRDARDQRSKTLSLSPAGLDAMQLATTVLWPRVRAAVGELCDVPALLDLIETTERALADQPLDQRPRGGLAIRRFTDALAEDFYSINAEWIETMYRLEQTDIDVLRNPRERIIGPGGDILFVEDPQLGIVGTCALQKMGERQFELTKMGVLDKARGRKAGEFLLEAIIARAHALGCDRLYLLSNAKSAAAIYLYEKLGFVHDAGIMEEFGRRYERCNVAMLYRPPAG
ncbi:bifunctional helix-turn-helix transcriptional regulator/GNAT family N-acetyltransferase [Sphingomonas nostoxanthinifaciens]|uniref:bifunctional helix-turn-helix transcriptional regulator/GNAT family N-acetyltransferase n=1 Tax=Sphingomonas nostoxanthinifaciens TaxID=2872652 RepID=UPI001CC1CD37|nr:bifunctional helix-turn-helix transcriptional regulator/GNAT family N-acetyltransferase [Sphingomonas nostoxanthinifaciens]UAK25776.1 bifunctional helix-turn-helix transcriptional regulator/GNAT family N-acetyltransferase [Sphingomonas nostoxanthinifaciens]